MHQVLLSIHGFALHSYGVLIALGFAVGIVLAVRDARRMGMREERVLDLCFWVLIAGLVGARILYILTNLPDYVATCREGAASGSGRELLWKCTAVLHIWEGGLVFYGGFFGALVAVLVFARRRSLPFLRTADALAPALAIGHFFGRLGCYAAGCCWGRVCGAWGARFPRRSLAFEDFAAHGRLAPGQELTPPVHPTQLYEAGGELLLFFLLVLLRRRKRFDGQLFLCYLFVYPLLRGVVEIFRGDAIRKFVLPIPTPRLDRWLGLPAGEPSFLSTSQFLSILVVVGAAALALALRRRARRTRAIIGA